MAIAFDYKPISTFKEGFDAIQEYRRLKLSKAMAQLQAGSQFGDPTAIAQGLEELGLSDTAKKYYSVADKARSQELEYGKKAGTEAALKEMYGENVPEALSKRIDKAGMKAVEDEATSQAKTQLINEFNREIEPVIKNEVGELVHSGMDVPTAWQEASERATKVNAGYGDDEFKKIVEKKKKELLAKKDSSGATKEELYRAAISGEAPIANTGKVTPAAIEKMPLSALTKEENLENIIYSSKDMSQAQARMAAVAKSIYDKKGGLDINDVLMLQNIEKGLNRFYGHEYQGGTKWEYMLRQSGGGGGKGSDYTYVDADGKMHYLTASSQEEAYKRGKAIAGKEGIVTKGTAKEVADLLAKYKDDVFRNEELLKTIGVKVGGTFLGVGEPKLVDIGSGNVVSDEEINRRIFRTLITKKSLIGGATSAKSITSYKTASK